MLLVVVVGELLPPPPLVAGLGEVPGRVEVKVRLLVTLDPVAVEAAPPVVAGPPVVPPPEVPGAGVPLDEPNEY
jgi:hypothetical protein